MRESVIRRLNGAAVLVLTCATASAAPTYDHARAFAEQLHGVVAEGHLVWSDSTKAPARAREIQALPAQARRLFGDAPAFQACVTAAEVADEYWQAQHGLMAQSKLTLIQVNGIARAGFWFGDWYRVCRSAIETLDTTPKAPPECFRVLDLTKPGAPESKPRPAYCKNFDKF